MSALPLANLVGNASALLGIAVAAIGLSAGARDVYQRTLGRRRDRYRRLARLGTEAQLGFFTAVLGEPPAIRHTVVKKNFREHIDRDDPRYEAEGEEVQSVLAPRAFTECFYLDRDYYVQTISDEDETVLAYSVTTRSHRFRPRLEVPPRPRLRERRAWQRNQRDRGRRVLWVQLGRTRFAELDPDDPEQFNGVAFDAYTGARSYSYSEFHYLGAGGAYQDFVLTTSSASPGVNAYQLLAGGLSEVGSGRWPDPERDHEPEWDQMAAIQRFRRETPITTYTVSSVRLHRGNYPSTYGPHGEGIRTLP